MARPKNKRNQISNQSQKQQAKKKLNPFEVHINKEKLKVLGKKSKSDRGLPGVSREKALRKRKSTLQQEFKLQHKSNTFSDKRIGERNTNMTDEDRFIARYAKLKAKRHKKSIFNLADEEVLTHKGQTLSEIEKFENVMSDDGDSLDGDTSGRLDADFVAEAHFGGGILKKTGIEGAKSHKDLIEQLITESKKRKAEKQKLKEETLELTEKLDSEWKDLLPLVNKSKSKNVVPENEKADDYDKVMRQLKFEARGTPSDRLKTEDEIAREAKEKLETLEKERLERMHGVISKINESRKHVSADGLDVNFVYDSETEVTLSYNQEGISNVELEAEINGKTIVPRESGDSKSDNSENNESSSESGNDENPEECEEESDNEDKLSDLKGEDSISESESELEYVGYEDKIREDLLKRKAIMENAREELPYSYNFPSNYEELHSLLLPQPSEHQFIILERLIKCHHPSLGEKNKENLDLLFAYLLQYINDISQAKDIQDINKCFRVFTNITPHLYDLAQMSPFNAHTLMIGVIEEKQKDYRKNKQTYPGNDIVLFLKLVSCIFPTSDFRHVVVTPAITFMDQMLNKCRVRTRRDIAYGLFLTTLALEYTSLTKRFLPSAINFLVGILHMAIPKTGVKLIKISPPFKISCNKLVLCNNHEESTMELAMSVGYLLEGEINDEFRIRAIHLCLSLLEEFAVNFMDLQSSYEIFIAVLKYLELVPMGNYPKKVKQKWTLLMEEIITMKNNRRMEYLMLAPKKPKALRLYEPNIEKVYDTKRRKIQSREKTERDKLLHKLKRERKGALREIRRDREFLSGIKINQKIQSDMERQAKVNKLLSEASLQQSELNAMDRKKNRKKTITSQIRGNVRFCIVEYLALALSDVLLLFVVDLQATLDRDERQSSQHGLVKVRLDRIEEELAEHVRDGRHQQCPAEHSGGGERIC
ncbi:hypothetical protein AMK59_8628 [Oryctes borbonicus]|uniref:Nucleolar protein 14 n=1 Tax=Oryctes borbonicus TaxID=1629725 RepID=A0A0T6B028_9SCAR|nr:hypothetical protein AMK59_8628 [Oryctes borbonicus]